MVNPSRSAARFTTCLYDTSASDRHVTIGVAVPYIGDMTRSVSAAALACATVLVAGCGSGARHGTPAVAKFRGPLPFVISHPRVGRPRVKLHEMKGGAEFVSPTELAFGTSGSSDCYWVPKRVTVLTRHAVRIDMRMRLDHGACLADLVFFPIAVAIGPRLVDTHHALTVHLAYAMHYRGEGTKHWHKTLVAAPL